jgi:hypothetical protein
VSLVELDVTGLRPPPPDRPRRWLGATLALLAVLGLAAAARPATRLGPTFVIENPAERVIANGHTLFLLSQHLRDRSIATAHRLPDGALLWSKTFRPDAEFVAANDDVLVLREGTGELIGVDARSGAPRWRHTELQAQTVVGDDDGVIVGLLAPVEEEDKLPLAAIDISTGSVRWSAPAVRRSDTRVLTAELDPDGTVRVRDLRSGAVTRTVRVPELADAEHFDLVDDALIAYRYSVPGGVVYNLATGRPSWTFDLGEQDGPVKGCGPVLCRGDAGGMSGFDAGTGRLRWRLAGWTNVERLDGQRLLLTRDEALGIQTERAAIVDAATGRVIRVVERRQIVAVRAWPELLVAYTDSGGVLTLGWLNAETGSLSVFGRRAAWHLRADCHALRHAVVCRNGLLVAVWPM